ncbi:MAG: VWA domain-containing protein [Candidatus Cloacimonetes bacterium]|nr:VWA domain-containing protein [Candidatus Cloacimonadota bacterium]
MPISFYHPWALLGLVLPILYLGWEFRFRNKNQAVLPFSKVSQLRKLRANNRFWRYFFPVLRALVILLIVIAISRPRWGKEVRIISQSGVDIVLAIDVSGSMKAVDFQPENRLVSAKKVARDFIRKRPEDRFGIVTFAEYALTLCPVTFDHHQVLTVLEKLNFNEDQSATAIGMGLAKAVSRLKDSPASSRIVILISDGANNTGEIDPLSSAEMAKQLGIKVYAIGVGTTGPVDFPIEDPFFGTRYQKLLIELDMPTLNKIAEITGTGKAALAGDTEQLSAVMNEIDRMEKTEHKIQARKKWKESFLYFLWAAFLLLALEILTGLFFNPILPE